MMAKPTNREILIRLDERSHNTWRVVEKLEVHAREQNGYIRENYRATAKNTIYRKIIIGIGGTALLSFLLHLIGVY